jgi:hypothetical protein
VLTLNRLGSDVVVVRAAALPYGTPKPIRNSLRKILSLAAWRAAQGQCAPSHQACRHTPAPGRATGDPRRVFVPQAKSLTSRLGRFMALKTRIALSMSPSPASSEPSALLASRPSPPLHPQGWARSLHRKRQVGEVGRGGGGGRGVVPRGRILHQGERHQPRRKRRRLCPAAQP